VRQRFYRIVNLRPKENFEIQPLKNFESGRQNPKAFFAPLELWVCFGFPADSS
jgi:hypothetical protein